MKVEITPTEKPEKLLKNIRPRVKNAELNKTKIKAEIENEDELEKIPGIKEYVIDGKTSEGLGGSPVDEKAYIKLNSMEDVAKGFLATASGYDLIVVECNREWDLRLLRKYNPSIKEVSEPSEVFEVSKSVNVEGFEDIGIEIEEEDVEMVYKQVVT
ncbi:MAG: hypothetical protein R6V35_05790 [Candidatus Nanohaloarchaea archaeon]